VEKGAGREVLTITEDAAKKELKGGGLCVDVMVVEDMLDGTNVAGHDAVILEMSCYWHGGWKRAW
jgi:hypothetical protein